MCVPIPVWSCGCLDPSRSGMTQAIRRLGPVHLLGGFWRLGWGSCCFPFLGGWWRLGWGSCRFRFLGGFRRLGWSSCRFRWWWDRRRGRTFCWGRLLPLGVRHAKGEYQRERAGAKQHKHRDTRGQVRVIDQKHALQRSRDQSGYLQRNVTLVRHVLSHSLSPWASFAAVRVMLAERRARGYRRPR